jgi:hypothetical protein
VRYAEWRATPQVVLPDFGDVDAGQARALVHAFLAGQPAGGWLGEGDAGALLRLYGIALVSTTAVPGTAVPGIEVRIGVTDDQMFGPLVVFGRGGVTTTGRAGQAARLAPLTSADADMLLNSIRAEPLPPGHPGAPPADLAALRDVLLRVSRLTEDLPEITELDLNPVIARPDGVVAVAARIRVAPQVPLDPFLRKLRLRPALFTQRTVRGSPWPG